MYEPFFGMDRRPFSATPDPACFFSSSELQAVLDELMICVERGQGIGILTAPAGLGKTLLCQQLAASIRERGESVAQFECVCLSNSNFPTRRSLLQAILFEMGDEYSRRDEPELRIDLRSRLLSLRPEREALVLIVDEAHLFGDELLEELRTLTDIADSGTPLVRIILSGQHELEERLTDRSFDALNQRISNHVFIESLTISESVEYIRHRLAWAGCDIESAFTEEAVGIITRASGGVPRCLNQLSDHSLLLAFASDQKPVTERTVREALEDLKQLPLHWNDVSACADAVGFRDDDEPSFADDQELPVHEDTETTLTDDAIEPPGIAEFCDASISASTSSESQVVATGLSEGEEAGIVESVQADEEKSLTDGPEAASMLSDGIEFDFSRSGDSVLVQGEADGQSNSDRSADSDGNPESSVFNFSCENPETQGDDSEATGIDETLLQVTSPQSQETLFESAELPGQVDVSDAASDDGAGEGEFGISFQLSSNGFELEGFDDVESQVAQSTEGTESADESGVIEFSFEDSATEEPDDVETVVGSFDVPVVEETDKGQFGSNQAVVLDSEAETPADDFSESEGSGHAVSVAEITVAVLGQDSVLPEHKSDLVATGPANADSCELSESFELESHRTEAKRHSQDEPAVSEAEAADQSRLPAAELVLDSAEQGEPEVADESGSGETHYEEALVRDPYAALQEPDGAGIVWDVIRTSASSAAETEQPDQDVENCEAVDESTEIAGSIGCEDAVSESVQAAEDEESVCGSSRESQDEFDKTTDEAINSQEELTLDESETENSSSESCPTDTIIQPEAVESGGMLSSDKLESGEFLDDNSADDVTENQSDECGLIIDTDFDADVAADEIDSFTDAESQDEEKSCETAETGAAPELHSFQEDDREAEEQRLEQVAEDAESEPQQHDIVEPVEAQIPQPDRLVDSILPLLNELDQDLDSVASTGVNDGRAVLDIEAELIQTIEHDSDEVEDQIGATMLDICLDTQSALHESAAVQRDPDSDKIERSEADDESTYLTEPFDIVQPDPQPREQPGSYDLPRASDRPLPPESSPHSEQAEKPFGRLFSDLRRRSS